MYLFTENVLHAIHFLGKIVFFSAVFSAFVYQILYPGVIKLKRMKICGNYTGYGINNM